MKSWNLFLVAMFWASSLALSAQTNELNLQHSLKLNEKSVEQSIKVDVAGDVESLKIDIRCSLEKGEVIIELYDPEGKRQGKFTLGSKTNIGSQADADGKNDVQREDGKLEKIVSNPVNGNWVIKITPTKTKAQVSIRTYQAYKS